MASQNKGTRGHSDGADESAEVAGEPEAIRAEADDDRSDGIGDAASAAGPAAESQEAASLSVVDHTARRSWRGGKRPGAGRKPATSSKPAAPKAPPSGHIKDIGVGREAAAALLALAEGGLMMAVGPKAAMLPDERRQIEPPLGRILARMSPQAATLVATFADPLMLGVGIVAYLTRITREDAPKRPAEGRTGPRLVPVAPEAPAAPATAPEPSINGQGAPAATAPLDNRDAALFAE